MKKVIILATLLFTTPSIASELGITASYGTSFRNGSGSSEVLTNSNSQLTEVNYFGSIKTGSSRTAVVDPLVTETTTSQTSGARNFTESSTTTGKLIENYTFGSASTNNFTGVFAR